MRVIRKEYKLIIENKDFLYGMMFFGLVILIGVLGFATGETNVSSGVTFGTILIIIALFTPATNIIVDYKNKELYIIKTPIIPIFQSKQTFPVKDIKRIYSDIDADSFITWFKYYIVMLNKEGQKHIILRTSSIIGGFMLLSVGSANIERAAKALDDKVQELKK